VQVSEEVFLISEKEPVLFFKTRLMAGTDSFMIKGEPPSTDSNLQLALGYPNNAEYMT